MASVSCQTAQWVSTSPYVKLTVSEVSSSETTTTLRYTLYYIASSAANTSVVKTGTITIGDWSLSVSKNINNLTGTTAITTGTRVIEKTKATRNIACSCTFGFELTWSGVYCGAKTASTVITIDAITSYQVTYNANGGTGAPSAQKKWNGETLTLSSTKPTRTGYTFQGWGVTASDTTVAYKPGASYGGVGNLTLYAIWVANTYAVIYNANGGTGAPAAQIKTHGETLKLTTSISNLKRTNYTFKGWATSATGSVVYNPGDSYTTNAIVTLYAVWELNYVLPKIYNTTAEWASDQGDSILVKFDWETTNSNPTATIAFNNASGEAVHTVSFGQLSGKSGRLERTISEVESNSLNIDTSYVIKITLSDGGGDTTSTVTLTGNVYPIDFLAGGRGVSFGGPASLGDTAHFQFAARFDKEVYGNVPGMNKLPEIPANDDFNDYITTGCWAVYRDDNAETIANIPVARAGRLEVWSSTGEGIRAEQWSYLRQRFIPHNNENATWERDIKRVEDNVWRYYEWHRTTLTPAASEKIYSKSAITAAPASDQLLGKAGGAYTIVIMHTTATVVGDRLTIADGAIKIGKNISHVRISGQTLVKCGSASRIRYARIQKVSNNGTQTNLAWACLNAAAESNIVLSFTPVITNVSEGDKIQMLYSSEDTADTNKRGSSTNGWQTYLTVEEL